MDDSFHTEGGRRVTSTAHEQYSSSLPPIPPEEPSKLLAILLWAVHRILELMNFRQKEAKASPELAPCVALFRQALELLKERDYSQEASYLEALSHAWQAILAGLADMDKESSFAKRLREVVDDVRNYPPGAPYGLGYYLSEKTGKEWLPLPCIELLHALHAAHRKSPQSSPLNRWTEALDAL